MKSKKVFSLALAALLAGTTLAGVGCKKSFANHDNALEVYLCKGGYGQEWLEIALKEFGKKQSTKDKYPQYTYKVHTNDNVTFGEQQVLSGATSFDVLFASSFSMNTAMQEYKKGQGYLECLDDVFASKIPDYKNGGYEKNEQGVEWTYEEKMIAQNPSLYYDTVLYDENGDPHQYISSRGQSKYGIVYNKTFIDGYGFKDETTGETILPRTTDELLAFAQALATKKDAKGNKVVPFVHSANTLYWPSMHRVWWGQYSSAQGYDYYFQGLWENENGEYERNVNVIKDQGKLKGLKVLENLIDYRNGLIHNESAALDFTMAQAYLIGGKGLMQANGDWFAQEMESFEGQEGADSEIRMMKDPIISALAKDKLSSVETDEEFSAAIGAIRAGITDLQGSYQVPDYSGEKAAWKTVNYDISQEDYNRIVEANQVFYLGERHAPLMIPSYSTAKELAKDFMIYMASDEFISQYMNTTRGASTAFYYDMEKRESEAFANLYPMQKDKMQHIKGGVSLLAFFTTSYPLITKTSWAGETLVGAEVSFSVKNDDAAKTAQELFDEQVLKFTKNNNAAWNTLLQMAGLG